MAAVMLSNAKVPAVGTSCTNPLVTQGNDFYFRVCFIDPFRDWLWQTMHITSLAQRKQL